MVISAKESSVKIYCGPCKDDKNNGDHNTIPQQTRYRLDHGPTTMARCCFNYKGSQICHDQDDIIK